MAMLHTVNKSPFDRNALESCLGHAKKGSTVLLIEDAVYAAMKGTSAEQMMSQAVGGDISVHVLGPDLKARGLSPDRLIEGVKVTDYSGFVGLVASHDNVQSWL